MQNQDSLPSIDKVTAGSSRLSSYRDTRRYQFHPDGPPILVLVNEEDRLLNMIYDDERAVLNDPPLPVRRVVKHPIVSQTVDEFEERLRQKIERTISSELRVERLSTVIVEFVADITRVTRE